MVETYYAGAYWRLRKESPEECSRRAEAFFKALAPIDPTFAQWFKQGRSRKEALKHRIELDPVTLEKMFRRGKDRTFEDLGFRISGWNGESNDQDACGFYITCGGYAEEVGNLCLLHLPNGSGPNSQRVLTAPVLTGLVRAMAVAWDPDDAVAMSDQHRNLIPDPPPDALVGWVTYLSRRRGTVPPLPAPVHIERVEDKGTLIVLTPERFTASNPEHVALAERVRELLDRAGLLDALRAR
ncbi:immunity 52 family protein [Archangium violaceum]|uniref:immunity 52 family protein n=1 Tax=Archangium violaceum TaxID=83451 RepID=UPI001950EA4B|nr:immunity 52 family protein [Archangium violaceum]QRN99256.1 immunity 52 family protein [Archangium violaceum]